ncbi:MAG: YceI family protein [Kiloniellales bacterium]
MTLAPLARLALRLSPALLLAALLPAAVATAAEAPQWRVEDGSRVGFVARQAGAAITGRFERFDAEIRFDPDNLDGSHVAVDIDVASVDTQSSDRDQVIRSADLFNVARWPSARFEAARFEPNGNGHYKALGQLTLREATQDVVLPFEITISEQPDDPATLQARAVGELPIMRLDYGVGQGQWRDTSVVANEVVIQIEILATRPKD